MGATLPVVFTTVTARLVGAVEETVRFGLESPAGDRMSTLLALAAGLFVVQQAIGPFVWTVTETLGRKLDGHFREMVMRGTLAPAGIAHLEDPVLLDKVSLARGVGPARFTPGRAVAGLTRVAGQYLQAMLFAAALIPFRWWLAIVLFAGRVLIRQQARRNYLRMINVFQRQAQGLRRSDYFRDLSLRPEPAKETRIFQLADWISERFTFHWREVMREAWSQRREGLGRMFPLLVLNWALLLFAYGLVATEGLAGRISVAEVSLYAMAIYFMRVMSWITDADVQTEYGMAAVPSALKIVEETSAANLEGGTQDPSTRPIENIIFESVGFTYPGSKVPVFEGLDLEIPAGRSLALVGYNGAGKTTLIKLLARFYDPQAGRITVDGIDLREFQANLWQERVAAIFQDFVRYQLPARDNLGFGALTLASDQEALENAARLSGALEIIENLPSGWDTILSRQYTGGADLSGGEWQKVALARALLAARERAGILVLDEPTANLDVRSEAAIYDRFFELTAGFTTIVVSHRFSTVRKANSIVVIERGRVIERGSHDELVALEGKYAYLFGLQASRFADAKTEGQR